MAKLTPGHRVGKLTTVREGTRSARKHVKWFCVCDCGEYRTVYETHLIQGNTKSCGCAGHRKGKAHAQFTGFNNITGSFWNHLLRCADGRKRKRRQVLEFAITIEYIDSLFVAQAGKCRYTGLALRFSPAKARTASLDRIDNNKGYIIGNVQWVHTKINMMKRDLASEEFVMLCVAVGSCER